MQFEFRGLSVHYEDEGEGWPLLLLNGVYMTCRSWRHVLPAFAARHRVLRVDFVDQGETGRMDGDYDLEFQADLVAALLDHVGLAQVDLVGTSYGGIVALIVALRRPDLVRRLVAANSAAYCSRSVRSASLKLNVVWDSLAKAVRPNSQAFGALGRITRSIQSVDERDSLEQVSCPTLVISAQHDSLTPRHLQLEILSRMPNARHAEIAQAGHLVVYEKPEEFAALALGFLDEAEHAEHAEYAVAA
ncbi:MAG: alpha/beta hydrolase [Propionibacteriaceae bacterium]|jgi:pimeloyl-ACP methyl ester carboxylesterase|nr:alpha/beta hydrolase [Propionibacteriaceae bacterium]